MDYRHRHGRRRSVNTPGEPHELTFTCYHGFAFLSRDRTREWLAGAVQQAASKWNFAVWAYVIMPEHAHLLVYPRSDSYDVSAILRAIKEPVGRQAIAYLRSNAPEWLLRITRQRGKRTEHLFWQSGGGYDRNIARFDTLEKMIAYIHANPVRRGLVRCAADWPWSSAAWYELQRPGLIAVDPINH